MVYTVNRKCQKHTSEDDISALRDFQYVHVEPNKLESRKTGDCSPEGAGFSLRRGPGQIST